MQDKCLAGGMAPVTGLVVVSKDRSMLTAVLQGLTKEWKGALALYFMQKYLGPTMRSKVVEAKCEVQYCNLSNTTHGAKSSRH